MQCFAPVAEQAAVGYLMGERVLEGVLGVWEELERLEGMTTYRFLRRPKPTAVMQQPLNQGGTSIASPWVDAKAGGCDT